MNFKNLNLSELSTQELYEWVKDKAYQLYIMRGKRPGSDWEDWFDAEKMLIKELLEK
ncbi:MAG: DUF2934 domain-containing protein [Candidatus Omnitrophica bacterium]|nr:DUF2934 domain-containing protein [Candidatus Omnitrophota bacterium]